MSIKVKNSVCLSALAMDLHPSYSVISPYAMKYPHLSGCLFLVYNDLLLAQRWQDLEIQELPHCGRIALKGLRPETKHLQTVVPCSLSESLSLDWLSSLYKELDDTSEVHLGITSDDSSIVYYRLSKGIVKPPS